MRKMLLSLNTLILRLKLINLVILNTTKTGTTMILKRVLSIGLLIVLNALSTSVFAQSSVWKVSKGDNYFYLGGTIHLLNPEDHPLPEEFTTAYKDADSLIFETDLAEAQSAEAQQKSLAVMAYSDGGTLKDDLSDESYSKLSDYLTSSGMPIQAFGQFKPWAVALTLTVMEYQKLGMQPDYGVDQHFNAKALADNKAVGELETFDEQLSFISSMGDIDPNIMVEYTIRDLKELPGFVKSMKNNWRNGDIEAFSKESSIATMKAEFPDLYDNLVVKRNNNWMPKLTALTGSKAKEFVLVGALHLSDKEGLINQLKLAGFTIDQL